MLIPLVLSSSVFGRQRISRLFGAILFPMLGKLLWELHSFCGGRLLGALSSGFYKGKRKVSKGLCGHRRSLTRLVVLSVAREGAQTILTLGFLGCGGHSGLR